MALKDVLRRNRLQQKEIAAALGVSEVTVGGWVSGRVEPLSGSLIRLWRLLRTYEPGLQIEEIAPESAAPDVVAPDSIA